MLKIGVDSDQLKKLQKVLGSNQRKLPREINSAINKTLTKVQGFVAKEVTQEVAVSQKVVKKSLASKRSIASSLQGTVTLKQTRRISLRDFGARQTNKGVSYKISRTKGRKTVLGAFQGPKPGVMKASWRGNVFKRVGKKRLPIVKLSGPSPWGVYVINGDDPVVRKKARQELRKQIDRRLRFLELKKTGQI